MTLSVLGTLKMPGKYLQCHTKSYNPIKDSKYISLGFVESSSFYLPLGSPNFVAVSVGRTYPVSLPRRVRVLPALVLPV